MTSSASVRQPARLEVGERLGLARGRVDGLARGGEALRGGAADAGRAAGDEDGLVGWVMA